MRLKKNEFVEVENGGWQALDQLGLEQGISLFLLGVKVTKTNWQHPNYAKTHLVEQGLPLLRYVKGGQDAHPTRK